MLRRPGPQPPPDPGRTSRRAPRVSPARERQPLKAGVIAFGTSRRASHCAACSRRKIAIGVAPPTEVAAGESRAQPTSPVRHSMSSSAGSYRSMRAGRIVRSHARRRRLEAVQERRDRAQAVDAREPAVRVEVVPREQEAHEVGRINRLDLGAQPVQRVAVDARQQRAIAPLHLGQAGRVGRLGHGSGFSKSPRSTAPSDSSASSARVGVRGRNPEVAGERARPSWGRRASAGRGEARRWRPRASRSVRRATAEP